MLLKCTILSTPVSLLSFQADTAASSYVFSDIDKLSMANVPSGSPLLWVHLAAAYLVTVIVTWVSKWLEFVRACDGPGFLQNSWDEVQVCPFVKMSYKLVYAVHTQAKMLLPRF